MNNNILMGICHIAWNEKKDLYLDVVWFGQVFDRLNRQILIESINDIAWITYYKFIYIRGNVFKEIVLNYTVLFIYLFI